MEYSRDTYEYRIEQLRCLDTQQLLRTHKKFIERGFLSKEEILQKMILDGFTEEQINDFKASQNLS